MSDLIQSRLNEAKPMPGTCLRCVFGTGQHSVGCVVWARNCCCSHSRLNHNQTVGKCRVVGCDCFNVCDCHVIAAGWEDDEERQLIAEATSDWIDPEQALTDEEIEVDVKRTLGTEAD